MRMEKLIINFEKSQVDANKTLKIDELKKIDPNLNFSYRMVNQGAGFGYYDPRFHVIIETSKICEIKIFLIEKNIVLENQFKVSI